MSMRKIVVNGVEWKFMVGKQNAVIGREGHKVIVPLSDIAGIPQEAISRGRRKASPDGNITPKMIREYILKIS